jgi:ABC-type xylose transport system permease subunit
MGKSKLSISTKPSLTLFQRIMSPTPVFFKKVRTVGVVMGVIGAALLAAPVALPAAIVTVGGYLTLAGSIVTAVAQTTTEGN